MSLISKKFLFLPLAVMSAITSCKGESKSKKSENIDIENSEIIDDTQVKAPPSDNDTQDITIVGSQPSKSTVICDLEDLIVEGTVVIARQEACESYRFKTIKVKDGGVLEIKNGVTLIGDDAISTIDVEFKGNLLVNGTETEKVVFKQDHSEQPLQVNIGGKASLNHTEFYRAKLKLNGVKIPKSINSLLIDNAGISPNYTAFECFYCYPEKISNLTIRNHAGSPVSLTLDSLNLFKRDSIAIESENHAYIELYHFGLTPTPRQTVHNLLPNLKYPYKVMSSLVFAGESFTVEDGVQLRFCKECNMHWWAKEVNFGSAKGESILLTAEDSWPGIFVYKSTEKVILNKTNIERTRGFTRGGVCPGSALAFEAETSLLLNSVAIKPTQQGALSLGRGVLMQVAGGPIEISPESKIYFEDPAKSDTSAILQLLSKESGIQSEKCRTQE
jgi:hypothetical protein